MAVQPTRQESVARKSRKLAVHPNLVDGLVAVELAEFREFVTHVEVEHVVDFGLAVGSETHVIRGGIAAGNRPVMPSI